MPRRKDDSAKKKRGPKGWADSAQVEFFRKRIPRFREAQVEKTFDEFWTTTWEAFNEKWPLEPLTKKEMKKEVTLAMKKTKALNKIKVWFNNNGRDPSVADKKHDLLNFNPRKKKRYPSYQAYSKLYYNDRIKAVFDERWPKEKARLEEAGQKPSEVKFCNRLTQELLAAESKEVKEKVEQYAKSRAEKSKGTDDDSGEGSDNEKDEEEVVKAVEYLKAQKALPKTMQQVLKQILRQTGAVGACVLGMPDPSQAGGLRVITLFSGTTEEGEDWGHVFGSSRWKKRIVESCGEFVDKVYAGDRMNDFILPRDKDTYSQSKDVRMVDSTLMSVVRRSDDSDEDDGSSKKGEGKQNKNKNKNKADKVGSSKTGEKKKEGEKEGEKEKEKEGEKKQETLQKDKKAALGGTEVGTSKSAARSKVKGKQKHRASDSESAEESDANESDGSLVLDLGTESDVDSDVPDEDEDTHQTPPPIDNAPINHDSPIAAPDHLDNPAPEPTPAEETSIQAPVVTDKPTPDEVVTQVSTVSDKASSAGKMLLEAPTSPDGPSSTGSAEPSPSKEKQHPLDGEVAALAQDDDEETRHISSENNHLIDICPVAYTEDRLVDNWPADSRKQWPEWLGPAVDALEKLCESAPWRQAVWTWICFEELMNYPVGQSKSALLGKTNRPAEIDAWIKAHRDYDKMPDIQDYETFSNQWMAWWFTLQPEWRGDGLAGKLLFDCTIDQEWDNLCKGSQNGFFTLLLSLGWWGQAVCDQGPDPRDLWAGAFYDLIWVLEQIVKKLKVEKGQSDKPKSSTKRPHEESEESEEPPSRRMSKRHRKQL